MENFRLSDFLLKKAKDISKYKTYNKPKLILDNYDFTQTEIDYITWDITNPNITESLFNYFYSYNLLTLVTPPETETNIADDKSQVTFTASNSIIFEKSGLYTYPTNENPVYVWVLPDGSEIQTTSLTLPSNQVIQYRNDGYEFIYVYARNATGTKRSITVQVPLPDNLLAHYPYPNDICPYMPPDGTSVCSVQIIRNGLKQPEGPYRSYITFDRDNIGQLIEDYLPGVGEGATIKIRWNTDSGPIEVLFENAYWEPSFLAVLETHTCDNPLQVDPTCFPPPLPCYNEPTVPPGIELLPSSRQDPNDPKYLDQVSFFINQALPNTFVSIISYTTWANRWALAKIDKPTQSILEYRDFAYYDPAFGHNYSLHYFELSDNHKYIVTIYTPYYDEYMYMFDAHYFRSLPVVEVNSGNILSITPYGYIPYINKHGGVYAGGFSTAFYYDSNTDTIWITEVPYHSPIACHLNISIFSYNIISGSGYIYVFDQDYSGNYQLTPLYKFAMPSQNFFVNAIQPVSETVCINGIMKTLCIWIGNNTEGSLYHYGILEYDKQTSKMSCKQFSIILDSVNIIDPHPYNYVKAKIIDNIAIFPTSRGLVIADLSTQTVIFHHFMDSIVNYAFKNGNTIFIDGYFEISTGVYTYGYITVDLTTKQVAPSFTPNNGYNLTLDIVTEELQILETNPTLTTKYYFYDRYLNDIIF